MKSNMKILNFDPEAACHQIEQFLRERLDAVGKAGILIGLSGGFDSTLAAYLSVRAVGKERVRLLNLPERDSKPVHRKHAARVAEKLGIPLEVKNLTPILSEMGVYRLLPIGSLPGSRVRELTGRLGRRLLGLVPGSSVLEARFHPEPGSLVARGNAYAVAKHRLRMLMLYQEADIHQLMVVGAANRTEWLTGTFSQWGCDHCADVMPLLHLYRSQLHLLAEPLGLPPEIAGKNADPDVIPGVDNKEALLGGFVETDQVLAGLEQGRTKEELAAEWGGEFVEQIARLYAWSAPMRVQPYHLDFPEHHFTGP
jgi:NAD+ synthase